MDVQWVTAQLVHYRNLTAKYEAATAGGYYSRNEGADQILQEAQRLTPTIARIFRMLSPDLPQNFHGMEYSSSNSDEAVNNALGILEHRDDWEKYLSPDAPVLSADELHPNVWASAAPLWPTGQYRTSVEAAALGLSAMIAKRAGSVLSERELVAYVFSPKPPEGVGARLHLPKEGMNDRTWRSSQEGLHLIAQGAFAGIRNIAAHTDDQWTEHEGLEQLAVLSTVARWTEKTFKVEAAPPAGAPSS